MEKVCTLLVGPIGSGKSTYAKALEAKGYVRINQDEQGKEGHLKKFKQTVEAMTSNIVVDRMNFNQDQRSRYWSYAIPYGYKIKIVEFKTPRNLCHMRALRRENHPTIKKDDVKIVDKVLTFFYSNYEAPMEHEYNEYEVRLT